MKQKVSNASIRDYFKPKTTTPTTTPSQQTQPSTQSHSALKNGKDLPAAPAMSQPVQPSVPSSSAPQDFKALTATPRQRTPSPLQSSLAPQNRKTVVRSSDSEDSDTSSGLDDLGVVLGTTPVKNSPAITFKSPIRTRRSVLKFNSSPMAVRPAIRYDMATLARQAAKERKTEQSREELMAILNDDIPTIQSDEEFDEESFIESVVPDEAGEGKAGKVFRAIKRQGVGKSHGLWLFFDFDTPEDRSKRVEFPQESLEKCRWKSAFTSASTLGQTILSGFADDMAAMGEELPEEVILWMLDEMCYEPRDSLRHSYSRIITNHSAHTISRLMVPTLIERLFQKVGGSKEATNISDTIGPVLRPVTKYGARSWDQLLSLVDLLGSIGRNFSSEARTYSVCLLARLCMDYIVVENISLFRAVQAAFKSLLISIPESVWTDESNAIKQTIFAFTKLPTLQLQVLRCIPDEGIPRLHTIRRQLSLSLFLDSPPTLTQPLSTTLHLPTLISRLRSPPFQITHATDYLSLSAHVNLLDIGLADGLHPGLDSSLDAATENRFNEDVDSIVRGLQLLESGLGQANAAQETRLHAKNVISLVARRIAGTVRTKEREKMDIWGETTRAKDLRPDNADMMLRFARSMGAEKGA